MRGLELGADEFLVKPVSKRAFLARVRSLLRRAAPPEETVPSYRDAALTLDFVTYDVKVRGSSKHLRPTEFRLLSHFVRNCDRVITHEELLNRVWGDQFGSLDSLRWYVASLRNKVEEDPRDPSLIVTVATVGYRYCAPSSPQEVEQQEG